MSQFRVGETGLTVSDFNHDLKYIEIKWDLFFKILAHDSQCEVGVGKGFRTFKAQRRGFFRVRPT